MLHVFNETNNRTASVAIVPAMPNVRAFAIVLLLIVGN